MNDRQNRQHGGIVAFVLVGVVLTALLAGGIYLSKNQGRTASTHPVTTTQTETPSPAENKDKPTESTPQSTPQQTTSKPAPPKETTPTSPAPQPTAPSTPTPAPTQPSGIATTGPSSIAHTGPTDVLFTIIALSVLAAAASAYRLSIQRMRVAALK